MEIHPVISVINLSLWPISYLLALWLRLCGPQLLPALVPMIFLLLFSKAGNGVRNGFPKGNNSLLLVFAAVCWSIWKMRNKICFEGKKFHNPIEIVFHACALTKFWAGLQKEVDKETLIKGVDTSSRLRCSCCPRSVKPSVRLACCKMSTEMMKLIKAKSDDKAWEATRLISVEMFLLALAIVCWVVILAMEFKAPCSILRRSSVCSSTVLKHL